jgi:integrase
VLRFALRRSYIADNPLRRLEPSERPHPERAERRVLNRAELARLLAGCPPRYRSLLATAVYTGVRLSELLGLSWGDVDFESGVIHVRHQLSRARIGSPARRVAPKTVAAVREIPLAPQLALLLRRHKHTGRFAADGDYVFATSLGTPLGHRNVEQRALARAADRAGINREGERRLRFHDLRHTFASHLIVDLRLDVAQVSRILGHASTSITLDTYTHLFDQAAHTAEVRLQIGRSEFANLLRAYVDGSTRCTSPRRRPRDRVHALRISRHNPVPPEPLTRCRR